MTAQLYNLVRGHPEPGNKIPSQSMTSVALFRYVPLPESGNCSEITVNQSLEKVESFTLQLPQLKPV